LFGQPSGKLLAEVWSVDCGKRRVVHVRRNGKNRGQCVWKATELSQFAAESAQGQDVPYLCIGHTRWRVKAHCDS
jgi:hypothetical protein